MHKIFLISCVLLATLTARAQAADRFVVMVPGFFNLPSKTAGVLPKYFGNTVLQTLRAQGLTPIVIDDLDPIGGLEENGVRVQHELEALASAHPGAQFDVIAHSAGGLYVAEALTKNPTLPVHHVITTCTPYDGVELVDLIKWIPGYKTLTSWLNLTALREFEAARMPAVRANLRIPANVKWTALAAAQPVCGWLSCAEADHQSWLLSLAWRFTSDNGDGVVDVSSAEARGTGWNVENWPGYVIPLEHWEVVLDADWFTSLGVADPSWIRQKQIEVFTRIGQAL